MKNKRRIFAWMLCLVLLGAASPMRVNAEDEQQSEEIVLYGDGGEPEYTEAEVESEVYSETETPIETEEAEEEPEATEEPEVVEEPEATEEPEVMEEPEATEEPEVVEEPEATEEPEVVEEPEATEEPEDTATPEPTATVETTATPEPTVTPEPTATVEPTVTPEPTSTPEPEEQIETIDWAQLRLDGNGDSARLVISVNNADGVRLEPFAVAIGGDTDAWQADDFWMDGASLSWENGEIVLWVYDGVAQGGEVLCGGRRLTLTLSRNGDAETTLTLAALDGDGNELDLRNSGDGRIKLQAHWDAKVVRQPVQIETELISNGSDGLAYGDTLEMTAVVNVQPTDAKWSIRWQYSLDGEHFEDVEGANEMRYAVKLDKINAQYYWRFVVSVED